MKLEVFSASHFVQKQPVLELCALDADQGGGGVPSSPLWTGGGGDELGSDGDCVANSPAPVTPQSGDGKQQQGSNKPYTRRPKPPYSYIALIAMAIRDSGCSGRLTLAEINDYLMNKFPFFRGGYTGWRNSVRHNLSLNDCFLKVLRDPSRPWGKDNYWMLNPHSEYTFADGVFRRRRKRISKRPHNKDHEEESQDLLQTHPGEEDTCSLPIPAAAAPASREREEKVQGVKFSSSFAIDSILSKPFKRREDAAGQTIHVDSNNAMNPAGVRMFWPAACPVHMLPYLNYHAPAAALTHAHAQQHTYHRFTLPDAVYSSTELHGRDALTYLQLTSRRCIMPHSEAPPCCSMKMPSITTRGGGSFHIDSLLS